MNLFVLDENPSLAARGHSDVHVNKMATEAGQIVTAALAHVLKSYDEVKAAKPGTFKKVWRKPFDNGWGVSHPYHPASLWAAASYQNAIWALQLGLCLANEWEHRFDKPHGARAELSLLVGRVHDVRSEFPTFAQQPFTIAFDRTKYGHCLRDTAVESYRCYYATAKVVLPTKGRAKWTRRDEPSWLNDYPTLR